VPESDLQDAVPDFKGMNLLGYDAMAVGNHEFDKPLAVLAHAARAGQVSRCCRPTSTDSGKRMFEPYKVFNLGGCGSA
jgi:5'-nucleotidase/UDP-sugar diphosphatase